MPVDPLGLTAMAGLQTGPRLVTYLRDRHLRVLRMLHRQRQQALISRLATLHPPCRVAQASRVAGLCHLRLPRLHLPAGAQSQHSPRSVSLAPDSLARTQGNSVATPPSTVYMR